MFGMGCNIVFGTVTVDPGMHEWGRWIQGVGVIVKGYLFNHVVILNKRGGVCKVRAYPTR